MRRNRSNRSENEISREIVLCAIEVHRTLGGPGLLESVIDLLIDGKVIIECKATMNYNTVFEAQALTYLRLTGLKLGMVINFGERMVKDGIHRVVNNL